MSTETGRSDAPAFFQAVYGNSRSPYQEDRGTVPWSEARSRVLPAGMSPRGPRTASPTQQHLGRPQLRQVGLGPLPAPLESEFEIYKENREESGRAKDKNENGKAETVTLWRN